MATVGGLQRIRLFPELGLVLQSPSHHHPTLTVERRRAATVDVTHHSPDDQPITRLVCDSTLGRVADGLDDREVLRVHHAQVRRPVSQVAVRILAREPVQMTRPGERPVPRSVGPAGEPAEHLRLVEVVLRLDPLGDVGDQREDPLDLPCDHVWHVGDLGVTLESFAITKCAVERGLAPGQRRPQVWQVGLQQIGPQHVREVATGKLADPPTDEVAVGGVGEHQAEVSAPVGDHAGQLVHESHQERWVTLTVERHPRTLHPHPSSTRPCPSTQLASAHTPSPSPSPTHDHQHARSAAVVPPSLQVIDIGFLGSGWLTSSANAG